MMNIKTKQNQTNIEVQLWNSKMNIWWISLISNEVFQIIKLAKSFENIQIYPQSIILK